MANHSPNPEKPRTPIVRPQITRLPKLTFCRRLFRRFMRVIAVIVVKAFTRTHIKGIENFPPTGPYIIAANHLGDADAVLGLVKFPVQVEALAKADLFGYPILGWIMDSYGVIWVHQGRPDRRAIKCALEALKQGLVVGIAPEARESLTGELEYGTGGAAYIAIKSGMPVLPVVFMGTENARVYRNMLRLRRSDIKIHVGTLFDLVQTGDLRSDIDSGTRQIMSALAALLPPEYRGVYEGY